MGLLDSLGTVFERAIPTAIGFATGGPLGAATSFAGVERAKRTQKNLERAEFMYQQDPGLSQGFSGIQPIAASTGSGSFFGNLGQTIGSFGRDVGGFVSDIAPALSLFGVGGQPQRTNAGTAISVDVGRPEESASSGEILGANLGMAPALFQAGRNFLRTPRRTNCPGLWCRRSRCVTGWRRTSRSKDYAQNEKRCSSYLYDGGHGSECHGTDPQ